MASGHKGGAAAPASAGAGGGTGSPLNRHEVAAACFDFLSMEFVHYLLRNCEDTRAGREAMYRKLENCGFEVGRRLAERMTKDLKRVGNSLMVVKFLCRDFWTAVFGKQMSKLQTNHKGVYVLQDFEFKWLVHTSGATEAETREMAHKALIFPCGLIRGVLVALGIECAVGAELGAKLPHCTFHLRVK